MIDLDYGMQRLQLALEPNRIIAHHRGPVGVVDPAAALREALRRPFEYPPLRRALTPDDRLAVVVDAQHPALGELLVALLDDLLDAGVAAEGLSLIGSESGISNEWIDFLPDRLEEAHVEEHDGSDRQKLAYLATTQAGRRLYLNRTLVEADLAIVLTLRRYHAEGYAGAEEALYPALGESALSNGTDTMEAAWLLGQPFYVQLIPAAGDGIAAVLAGAGEAAREGERRLDAAWHVDVPRLADCVVVGLSGDPSRHTFADLSSAVAEAAQVVTTGGRIIVLSEATPRLNAAAELLLRADEPQEALVLLRKSGLKSADSAMSWAQSAERARISLYSGLPAEVVEDLFATPLENVRQVGRLLAEGGECIVLQDGHRTRARLR